jgi:hypothetical protein
VAEERDDLEVAWARIVADYDRAVDDPVARWPIAEDVSDATADPTADPGPARTEPPSGRLGQDLPAVDHRPDAPDEGPVAGDRPDSEHHYVPPEPPPLGRPDLPTGIAWAGVLGGPVLLLLAAVLTWDLPGLLTAACVIGFVGGVVFLVATMDDGQGRDGWDDGAQV